MIEIYKCLVTTNMHGVPQCNPAFTKDNGIDSVSKPSMKTTPSAHSGAGNLEAMPRLRKRKEICMA